MAVIPRGPVFSVQHIPFSRRGAWSDISPVIALHTCSEDLHLVSHRNGMHAVLRLVPVALDSGDQVGGDCHATPTLLTWSGPGGRIDLTYEDTDTVRLRGQGVGLSISAAAAELTPFSGTYLHRDPVDGSFQFTSYETGLRYRVTLLEGTLADFAGGEALAATPRGIVLAGPAWEAVIQESEGARTPYRRTDDFDSVVEAADQDFRAFTSSVVGTAAPHAPAGDLAAYVLWSTTVRPSGFVGRPAVLMSKHWMDKVWSWDHCFNALALADGAPELAWDQFQLPFDHQDESGALPDSVTHAEVLYNFVKPPVHGWALRRLRARLSRPVPPDELHKTYDRLARWTGFWLTARRVPAQALPHYHHGNDSGWDNATTFDERRVLVTADLAAFLVLQLRELAALAGELGRDGEAVRHADEADTLLRAMLDELWVDGRFQARSPHTGQTFTSRSLLDLMPIVLGEHLPPEISATLAEGIASHLTAHGLATEHPQSPHYEPDGYWRGPIWAPSTVLIEDGLRRAGHTALADDISARFRATCEKHGFAENFDALTGQGLRDRAYTWTASAYLVLAQDAARRASKASGTAPASAVPGC